MKEDYHVDISGRFYEKGNTGVAYVGAVSKKHKGCVLSGRMKRYIEKTIFVRGKKEEYAKLHAICIYYLIKEDLENIRNLIVCNDENFYYVREYLALLLKDSNFKFRIISITEFQNNLGRRVKSLADNFAKHYRKRALKKHRWNIGRKLNVMEITYFMISVKWKGLLRVDDL